MKFGLINRLNKLFQAQKPAQELAVTLPAPTYGAKPLKPPRSAPRGYTITGDLPALVRIEIIDDKKRLCGYRFSLVYLQQGRTISESLFFEVMHRSGVPGFASRRLAVIVVDPENMEVDRYDIFNGPGAYLQIDVDKTSLNADDLVSQLMAIRKSGARIALRGLSFSRAEQGFLKVAQMVFLDMNAYSLERFQQIMRQLRATLPDLPVVIENVASWPEYRMCIAWGARYCTGDFLTSIDAEESDGSIDHSHLTAIDMLNLLRSDGDLDALSEIAKKDPGITFKLLGWANSPANGFGTTITSLSQAIVILGRQGLYRWLTISMFRLGVNAERNESVLEIALARARLLETLPLPNLSKAQREDLFMVGLFSLFDVLLQMSFSQIFLKINFTGDASEVLLHNRGPYVRFLILAIMLEKGQAASAAELATSLELPLEALETARREAFAWSQAALGMGR